MRNNRTDNSNINQQHRNTALRPLQFNLKKLLKSKDQPDKEYSRKNKFPFGRIYLKKLIYAYITNIKPKQNHPIWRFCNR